MLKDPIDFRRATLEIQLWEPLSFGWVRWPRERLKAETDERRAGPAGEFHQAEGKQEEQPAKESFSFFLFFHCWVSNPGPLKLARQLLYP